MRVLKAADVSDVEIEGDNWKYTGMTFTGDVKILTSCPACLQGLSRYGDDLANGLLEADYIVVEMARRLLGSTWLEDYVARANAGGIERVLV